MIKCVRIKMEVQWNVFQELLIVRELLRWLSVSDEANVEEI